MSAVDFAASIVAALLPFRLWPSLPERWPMTNAAVVSGMATLFAGAGVGIPGFIDHARGTSSIALDAMLHRTFTDVNAGYNQGMVQGFTGLSIFTFLLLTPTGWLTIYLMGTGTLRMAAAWFDDPVGDPILTGMDAAIVAVRTRVRARRARRARQAREGPEIADRVLAGADAGLPDCDLVVVSSRQKDGWTRGVVVFTNGAGYRLGEPIERTVAGRLRTFYPLTEHRDLEAIRRSVHYDMPAGSR
ncbi:MAG: hypothetical protein ACRD1V_20560 [Vicinamibacterales bacterium]